MCTFAYPFGDKRRNGAKNSFVKWEIKNGFVHILFFDYTSIAIAVKIVL